jgi:hypothetical protein
MGQLRFLVGKACTVIGGAESRMMPTPDDQHTSAHVKSFRRRDRPPVPGVAAVIRDVEIS